MEGILEGIEQLHPIADNIKYTYLDFLAQFKVQFADSTKQEVTQASLNYLTFHFPNIDQYISNFEMLSRKARYSIGSQELMNMFLKGLNTALNVIKRVIDKMLADYYDLKEKTIMVVKNQQLIWAIKNNTNALLFQRPPQ